GPRRRDDPRPLPEARDPLRRASAYAATRAARRRRRGAPRRLHGTRGDQTARGAHERVGDRARGRQRVPDAQPRRLTLLSNTPVSSTPGVTGTDIALSPDGRTL